MNKFKDKYGVIPNVSDRDFFTTESFFEVEIIKKLFITGSQQLARDIATELYEKAMIEVMDADFIKKSVFILLI